MDPWVSIAGLVAVALLVAQVSRRRLGRGPTETAGGATSATSRARATHLSRDLYDTQRKLTAIESIRDRLLEAVPGPALLLTARGEILRANRDAAQTLDLEPQGLVGRSVAEFGLSPPRLEVRPPKRSTRDEVRLPPLSFEKIETGAAEPVWLARPRLDVAAAPSVPPRAGFERQRRDAALLRSALALGSASAPAEARSTATSREADVLLGLLAPASTEAPGSAQSLLACLEDVAEVLRRSLVDRGVELDFDLPGKAALVELPDAAELGEVLAGLIVSALSAADAGSACLRLRISRHGNHDRLRFSLHGETRGEPFPLAIAEGEPPGGWEEARPSDRSRVPLDAYAEAAFHSIRANNAGFGIDAPIQYDVRARALGTFDFSWGARPAEPRKSAPHEEARTVVFAFEQTAWSRSLRDQLEALGWLSERADSVQSSADREDVRALVMALDHAAQMLDPPRPGFGGLRVGLLSSAEPATSERRSDASVLLPRPTTALGLVRLIESEGDPRPA